MIAAEFWYLYMPVALTPQHVRKECFSIGAPKDNDPIGNDQVVPSVTDGAYARFAAV
jgi:hypothetical protein